MSLCVSAPPSAAERNQYTVSPRHRSSSCAYDDTHTKTQATAVLCVN